MPAAYHAFDSFFSSKSRKATVFGTLLGLFQFTKLQTGISIGCQDFCHVVDSLFVDTKQQHVYNFMDDLVISSETLGEHLTQFDI
jgi:hypothetical protein